MTIKQTRSILITAIGAFAIMGALILFLPAGAQAGHCKGKHKNDPGCDSGGNGGGSSEILVTTSFNCPISASRDCPAGDPSSFQADSASSPYFNDDDSVKNLFNKILAWRR